MNPKLIILFIFMLSTLNVMTGVNAVWWNESWDYQKEIQIDGTGLEIPANYQLKLEVDYESSMNSTFKDLRFTNSDENVSLDYWVEQNVSSTNATVWVEVPSISNTTNTTVYMYYGNPTATSESNGHAVFPIFDDFNDGTINTTTWYHINNAGTSTESSGVLHLTGGSLAWNIWVSKYNLSNINMIMESRMKMDELVSSSYGQFGLKDYIDQNRFYVSSYPSAKYWRATKANSNNDVSRTYSFNSDYQILKIIRINTTSEKMYVEDVLKHERTVDTYIATVDMAVTMGGYNTAYDIYTDWVRVRKYTATEPTYSFGAEESQNIAPTITLSSPSDDSTNASKTVSFRFTPIDETGFTSCALWTNETSWSEKESNTSSITNNSINTIAETFTTDGTYLWNVKCIDSGSLSAFASSNWTITIDTTAPTYSDNSTNTTAAGASTLFSLKWENSDLDGYIFSFDNGTGSFTNDSFVEFSGVLNWSNVTKTVNSTIGATVQWKVYANDSVGNLAVSNTYSYLTIGLTTITTLYLDGINQDRFYELGYNVSIIANVTYINGTIFNDTICLDIDSTNYGENYICSNGTVEYTLTAESTLDEFNNSATEFISNEFNENNIAWFTMSNFSQLASVYLNISGTSHKKFKEWKINESFGCGVPEDPYDAGDIMYNFSGNEKWTLILAHYDSSSYIGYQWNGTCWELNSSLVVGLTNSEEWINPKFNFNFTGAGNTHLFVGLYTGNWTGYTWNGTGWDINTSIINGIDDRLWVTTINIGYNIFDEGNWTVMTSSYNDDEVGYRNYYYNGSIWIEDITKICGLPSSNSFLYQNSEYYKNAEGLGINRIIATSRTTFQVYQWNSTCWIRNSIFETAWPANVFPKPIILSNFYGYDTINFEFGINFVPQEGLFDYYRSNISIDYNNDSINDIELPGYLYNNYSNQIELKNSEYYEDETIIVTEIQSSIRYLTSSKDANITTANLTLEGTEISLGTDTNLRIDVSRVGTPRGINLDSDNRFQVVGDNGVIYEFDISGNYYNNFNSTIENAWGIADNSTHYFITDNSTNKTHLLLKNGTYIKEQFTFAHIPHDLDYADGYLWMAYWSDFNGYPRIAKVNSTTGAIIDSTSGDYLNPGQYKYMALSTTYATYLGDNYLWEIGLFLNWHNESDLDDDSFTGFQFGYISGIEADNTYLYVTYFDTKEIFVYVLSPQYPSDVTVNIGADNTIEYSMSSEFNDTREIDLNITSIQNYIDSTECESPVCDIPIIFTSTTPGYLIYSNIEVNYTYNPIELDIDKLQFYIDSNTGSIDIPINITADYWGNITLENLNVSYYGNSNLTVNAHFDGIVDSYEASNNSQLIKIIWSNFNLALPNLINYIDYFPLTINSKNVTPFGQTSNIPIINISSLSTQDTNYSVRFDTLPNACMDETISNSSIKSNGGLLTETLTQYLTLISMYSNGLWLWRDYTSCTPDIAYNNVVYNISACCSECVSCW